MVEGGSDGGMVCLLFLLVGSGRAELNDPKSGQSTARVLESRALQ